MCRTTRRRVEVFTVSQPSYRWAVMLAVVCWVGVFFGTAAGRHATILTAIPYALATAVAIGLALCALVAYKRQ